MLPFRRNPHPQSSMLPEIILKLNPIYISIYTDIVFINLEGGMGSACATVFSEGFTKQSKYLIGDEIKLLDGLWFYDDDYRGNADYKKIIKSWGEEKKKK